MQPTSINPCPATNTERGRPALRRIAAVALALLAIASVARAHTFSLEDRIACQTALDDVRWSQSLWPDVNPGPKPPRADVLPDDAIRAKVIDQLRREQALLGVYGESIDTLALQGELDRMARDTRAPEQLRELHAALGNDAETVAECLARPTLVERRLRQRYTADRTLHADVRARAEQALAKSTTFTTGSSSPDTQTHTVTYVRVDDPAEHARATLESGEPTVSADIALDKQEWDELLAELDRAAVREAKAAAPQLEESDTALYHRSVVDRKTNRLVLEVRVWNKRSFESWWRSEAAHWEPLQSVQEKSGDAQTLSLPPMHVATSTLSKNYEPGDVMPDDTWRTENGAPTGRSGHSAILIGSEMIVWGGLWQEELASGGRFNLITGTWKPMATGSARKLHTAVWTGKTMIVWGGIDGSGARSNSGASYDPETDTWTVLPNAGNVVSARQDHTAIWTGSEMLVWGGETDLGKTNTGARYNPATKIWTAIPTLGAPPARNGHRAVWASSLNRMVVWGGMVTGDPDSGGIFNPSGTWESTPGGGPAGRAFHTAVWADEVQTMIVWGGFRSGDQLNSGGRLKYDAGAWSWADTFDGAGAPNPRDEHTAVWTGDRMIIFGGFLSGDATKGASYDPVTDTWVELPLVDQPDNKIGEIHSHTAVWSPIHNRMVVWGGSREFGGYDSRTLIYNPLGQGKWTIVGDADLPRPRRNHTAVWTGTQMLIWGGTDEAGTVERGGERYDPATGDWLPMPDGVDRRTQHTAVWTGIDMMVWGGYNAQGDAFSRGARYNPMLGVEGEWVEPSVTLGPPRAQHKAVWTGQQMLLWGGFNSSGWLTTGTAITPGAGNGSSTGANFQAHPQMSQDSRKRSDFAMAWSPESNEMIVWGGRNTSASIIFSDGWRYNPTTKLSTLILASGDPRYGHEMAWTGNSLLVVGGLDDAGNLAADTWAYFPADNAWTVAGALADPRIFHTLVWTDTEALAWGGMDESGFLQSGERITPPAGPGQAGQVVPMSTNGAPPARAFHSAVWRRTPQAAEMLIWGGNISSRPWNDLGVYSASGDAKPPFLFSDGFE